MNLFQILPRNNVSLVFVPILPVFFDISDGIDHGVSLLLATTFADPGF